ncbi:type-2 ice-structuring protein-like [Halichoeres trimaculatus]|uniref:type-2 ice-structuring protein-like n=1 Tax=Halichoeres trimaculatus TaxID=147232 RepID=UPI003D9DEC6A
MKILAVAALLCALMALTPAAPAAEEEPEEAPAEDLMEVVKRDLQGWSRVGRRYFRYEARKLTWHEAEGNCRSLGGHLASLHSYNEYQLVQSLITPSGNPSAWLGGSDALQEGVWEWTDGTTFQYRNWCTAQPDNWGNEDCLQMSYSNHKCWNDVNCGYRYPSVCAKKWSTEREEALEDLAEVVKRGWSKVGGRKFFYESKEMSWQDADRNCLSMNLRLVSVHTREETQHIQYLMGKHGAPSVWLGSFYSPGERRWVWADGTKLRYEEWCNGVPYTSGNMRCLQMTYSNKKQCWDGDRCDYRRPSLCA